MKHLLIVIFSLSMIFQCFATMNHNKELYDFSEEIFFKLNNLRKEHGKINQIQWNNTIYQTAKNSLNQIIKNSETFSEQVIFDQSLKEQYFVHSIGEIITKIDSKTLNPEEIIDSWRHQSQAMSTILKDYEIGAVCVQQIEDQLHAVGIFLNVMIDNEGPQGEKGERGIPGVQGPQGEKGEGCDCSEAQIEQQNYRTLPDGSFASNCEEYQNLLGPYYEDGTYMLRVNGRKMKVYCEDGWIIILRRTHDTNFYQDWQGYVRGFGEIDDDYWLGLQNLHELTKQNKTLQIDLWHNEKYANSQYSGFQIGSGQTKYTMTYDQFEGGEAGNSFEYHKNQKFSTYDQDNDQHEQNCAQYYECGWWFNGCHQINLNGRYSNTTEFGMGINCNSWLGQTVSLTKAIMKIK